MDATGFGDFLFAMSISADRIVKWMSESERSDEEIRSVIYERCRHLDPDEFAFMCGDLLEDDENDNFFEMTREDIYHIYVKMLLKKYETGGMYVPPLDFSEIRWDIFDAWLNNSEAYFESPYYKEIEWVLQK